MSGIPQGLSARLLAVVGEDALVLEGDDLQFYGADRCRGGWPVDPGAIVLPRTTAQVAEVVTACAEHGAAIVPSGGRTGLAGAATATRGEVVVSLQRMHAVLDVDATARWLRCQAGATVEVVREAAAASGLSYPIDFAAKGSAQIGGSIATNAGGINVLRYGMTRDWVMGLKVVTASGTVLDVGGSLAKDNTGYDLRQLFIGSEGTLGIIVEATLGLCAPPAGRIVALAALPTDAAVLDLFARVRRASLVLSAFECFDGGCIDRVQEHRGSEGAGPFSERSPQHVLVEVELEREGDDARQAALESLMGVFESATEDGLIEDAVISSTPAQERLLWGWREDISESLHVHSPHKADVALPISKITQFLDEWRQAVARELPEISAVCFGHVGDGNLHLNLLRPPDHEHDQFLAACHAFDPVVYGLVERYEGSVSAEHGVGLLKKEHLHHTRSPAEIEMMKSIKAALDPQGLFNPGKVF
jgi:FAD/FMN-containing dehydrogenase